MTDMTDEELVKALRDFADDGYADLSVAAADRIKALTAEVGELQEVFDFQWRANMRAVEMWRAANPGNDLVLPDSAKLTVWMLERNEALTAKLAKAVEGLDKAAALIEDRHVVHMTSKGRNPKDYISDWFLIAKEVRAVLAEIEGEKK
jgi:hypothetical protein